MLRNIWRCSICNGPRANVRLCTSARIHRRLDEWTTAGLGGSRQQIRGAKRKTSVKLSNLQQGPLNPLDESPEEDIPSYPATIQGHLNNVRRFEGCVILTKVGNFYELYAEQAEQYGPLLNLKVAQRRTGRGPVAMSGFQSFQLDRYLKMLVQDLNMPVAISDEIPHSPSDQIRAGGLMYNRKVTRVVTAGTLIDESFVDPYESNYLLSVHAGDLIARNDQGRDPEGPSQPSSVGVSWVDLSSGEFFIQETTRDALSTVVARIAPREVLIDTATGQMTHLETKKLLGDGHYSLTTFSPSDHYVDVESWTSILDRPLTPEEAQMSEAERYSVASLLDYVQDKLKNLRITLRPPVRRRVGDYMSIDKHSLRGLEIRETMRDGFFKGSLLHAVKRTVTKSGTRALTQRLLSPSMSISIINERLDLVDEMVDHEAFQETTRAMLERTFDTPRLLTKFSVGRGDADDLVGIGKTVDIMDRMFGRIRTQATGQTSRERLASIIIQIDAIDFGRLRKLARRIQDSIDEIGLSAQHNAEQSEASELEEFADEVESIDTTGKRPKRPSTRNGAKDEDSDSDIWIMKREASPTLAQAHEELDRHINDKRALATHLRDGMSLKSLTLRWLPNLNYHCHVKGKDSRATIKDAISIGTSKTTRTFALPSWTSLGKQIDEVKMRIKAEEQRVFAVLRDEIISNLVKLRRCSSILDELDIACSSAQLAKEGNLCRPILHEGTSHIVLGGRHPMVDAGLTESGRSFTSNDCSFSGGERIMLVTGPNMAGKSTYLRQNALISILAQTGCYVPADYAKIGFVDKIFSRIGSADNLYNHQSTFMVEMIEVAEILNQATKRSFIIMDEVGRGTTPEDGIAVGYSCLKYLHDKIGCRALFATHFHALADMTAGMQNLACWCTDVAEEGDGSWTYVHKLRRGVNRDSHALKVAKLAGLPAEAVATAREVLSGLKVVPALPTGNGHGTGPASRQSWA